ncbi:flavin-binding monooxygenase-like protein [Aspergillus brunneoviolaceus CBS 621.78]|uniref:FAD/NAD(P)-binding domain-containing protein n=1 Tax=Aspergillus brunneoviolaceus CBS 621.78 TaxID=1450534 RepID=A0ACD1GHW9_9EURO|nr:FAD/NAD(P)-binding domain-containing protein [Aspergillus brunneoviolaceus CBS 621.78]RAH48846.1 FAD/NAD(P)-binding domain-containing protein [Aspergillus brunneoviolaceus CBS 621.78]
MESVDVTIIGAGWSGLAALKTYHQVHPNASILLLETADTVGGVWAQHRLYEGLKSNNMRGTYEFSDFPLDDSYGVAPGEHLPGAVIQKYLTDFAEHFHLTPHIHLRRRVRTIQHEPDTTWTLTVDHLDPETPDAITETSTLHTSKLILATGITSQPYLPDFPGQEQFTPPLFHIKDLRHYQDQIFAPPPPAISPPEDTNTNESIVIFGGTKSAWDAVYAAATTTPYQVDWIIRSTGHGPVWMAPPYVTPLKKWLEKLVTTRLLTWFSPCIWGAAGDGCSTVRRLLHGTWLGRKVVDAFWWVLGNDVLTLNNYAAHPETRKLVPWISPFWIASGLSILNYPTDFFELVRRGRVRVHVDEVAGLSDRTVTLGSGRRIEQVRALVCATGWKAKPEIQFVPASLEQELGLPEAEDCVPREVVRCADHEIRRRFPRLQHPPPMVKGYRPLAADAPAAAGHPLRLTRFMVPVGDLGKERSIACLGLTMTINTAMVAQAQALWVAAWMGEKLNLKSQERCPDPARKALRVQSSSDVDADLVWETTLHSQFGVHRYPGGFGRRNPDFVFDALPYVDLLLRDLGLDYRRKGKSLKWLEPYGMEDYRGLVEEWMVD